MQQSIAADSVVNIQARKDMGKGVAQEREAAVNAS
jgi:hypothetical protein